MTVRIAPAGVSDEPNEVIAVVPATLFWRHTLHLFCFVVVFAATYVWLYVSIVRFKSPRWMVVRKGRR